MSALIASTNNYNIPSNALKIKLNAMGGQAEYLEITSYSNAKVSVFMRGVVDSKGHNLNRDDKGNNKQWLLEVANTMFEDSDARYLYLAISRESQRAILAWPKFQVDIYGKTYGASEQDEEQLLPDSFFYIKIGKVSSSVKGYREWEQNIVYGLLNTDEGREQSVGDNYLRKDKDDSTLYQIGVGALKIGSVFVNTILNSAITTATGAANWAQDHGLATTASIASYISFQLSLLNSKFLRKDTNDSTPYTLTVGEMRVTKQSQGEGVNSSGNLSVANNASIGGNATVSKNATITGKTETGTLKVVGDSTLQDVYSKSITNSELVTTKNLKVTGRATFFELMIQKIKSVGGSAMFTPADGFKVEYAEYDKGYMMIYFRADDGTGAIQNTWKVGDQALCMNFHRANVGEGTNVSNTYWWALVVGIGTRAIQQSDADACHFIRVSCNNANGECDGSLNQNNVPQVGDEVVMCGYRGTDDPERQSAIYIASYDSLDTGIKAPFIAQYKGINDFNLASHRKNYFDALGAEFFGNFKVTTGSTYKDLATYVDELAKQYANEALTDLNGRIIINGDDKNAPTTDSAFIAALISNIGDENVTTIADLVGSVYITTEKKFYMLTYNESTHTYSWTEDTDETLKALYDEYGLLGAKISLMADDYCVSEAEKNGMQQTLTDIVTLYDHASGTAALYEISTDSLDTAKTTLSGMLNSIISNVPCYFSDAEDKQTGVYVLNFTRQEFFTALASFREEIEVINDAVIDFTANNIGTAAAEAAKQTAIEYVQDNIEEITGEALNQRMTNEIIPAWYNANLSSTMTSMQSQLSSINGRITATSTYMTKVSASVSGLVTNFNSMFAGTSQVNFVQDKDENGNALYIPTKQATNDKGQPLYWTKDDLNNDVQTTEVTSSKVWVGDYDKPSVKIGTGTGDITQAQADSDAYTEKMIISNTNTSGLVTKDGFAALFAKSVDDDDNLSAIAMMAPYVEKVYVNALPTGVQILPTENKCYDSSTKKWYYKSISDADIAQGTYYYVRSTDLISADQVIIESGNKALGNYFSLSNGNLWCQNITVEGVINNLVNKITDADLIDFEYVKDGATLNYKVLDPLCLGDVVELTLNDSVNDGIMLPYYLKESNNMRTPTKYGGTQHMITRQELKQLIGRKITIIVKTASESSLGKMLGAFYFMPVNSTANTDQTAPIVNGVPYVEEPTTSNYGVELSNNTTIHIEFKLLQLKVNGSNDSYYGYGWTRASETATSIDIDEDENWNDVEEEEE